MKHSIEVELTLHTKIKNFKNKNNENIFPTNIEMYLLRLHFTYAPS